MKDTLKDLAHLIVVGWVGVLVLAVILTPVWIALYFVLR